MVDRILANANEGELVCHFGDLYNETPQHPTIEGYPTERDPNFRESNTNHLAYATIGPILSDFIRKTGSVTVQLQSEREIVSTDGEMEEFTALDLILVKEERFIPIVEAKRSSLGQAMKQCPLVMRNRNGESKVYGFVTTGKIWQMLGYGGAYFQITEEMVVLFYTMNGSKEDELHVHCIKQRRHCSGMTQGEYSVEIFLGGICLLYIRVTNFYSGNNLPGER